MPLFWPSDSQRKLFHKSKITCNNRLFHLNWLTHILIHWSVFQKDNDRRENYWRTARKALAGCSKLPYSCSQEGPCAWALLPRLVTTLPHTQLPLFSTLSQPTISFAVFLAMLSVDEQHPSCHCLSCDRWVGKELWNLQIFSIGIKLPWQMWKSTPGKAGSGPHCENIS